MTSMQEDADGAIRSIAEGYCPLCHVELIVHRDKACCPCGGCSYSVRDHSLSMDSCEEHPPVRCVHWQHVWSRLDNVRDDKQ